MPTIFQKLDFQELLHFPGVFPGGKLHPRSFQEYSPPWLTYFVASLKGMTILDKTLCVCKGKKCKQTYRNGAKCVHTIPFST